VSSADLVLPPHEIVKLRSQSGNQLTVEMIYNPVTGPSRSWKHPDQDERLEVLDGSLKIKVGAHTHEMRTGDVVAIPRGTSHQVWNESGEPTRVLRRMTAPGRAADYFAAFNDVARQAEAGKAGVLQSSVLVTEYSDVMRAGGITAPVKRAVLNLLGFIGRRRGYRAAGGGPP
jgi:quercetin dioxygenase-like cupin family protein